MANGSGNDKDRAKENAAKSGSEGPDRKSTPKISARPPKQPVTIDLEAKDFKKKEDPTDPKKQEPADKKSDDSKASAAASSQASAVSSNKSSTTSQPTPAGEDIKPGVKGEANKPASFEIDKKTSEANETGGDNKDDDRPVDYPVSEETKKQSSLFGTLIAACIGGILAIGIFYGLQAVGLAPAPVEDLSADLGDLEVRLADVEANSQSEGAIQNAELESALSRLAEVETIARNAQESAADAVNAVENIVIPEAPSGLVELPTELTARLEALEARLGDLEQNPVSIDADGDNAVQAGDSRPVPNAIYERLSALETRLSASEERSSSTTSSNVAEIQNLGARVGESFEAVNELKTALSAVEQNLLNVSNADIEAVQSGLSEAVAEISDIRSSLANVQEEQGAASETFDQLNDVANSLNETLASLDASLVQQEQQIEENRAAIRQMQTVNQNIALANFRTIVATGGSYDKALEALKTSGLEEQSVAVFEPYSQTGLKSEAELARQFDRLVADAARLEPNADGSDGAAISPLEKLLNNATSVINLRRVDGADLSEDSALSSVKSAFQERDVDALAQALEGLSPEQKAVFSNWFAEWRARRELARLIDSVEPENRNPQSDSTSQ